MTMDKEPTPKEIVAMHLWKTMPPEIPVFIKIPLSLSPDARSETP